MQLLYLQGMTQGHAMKAKQSKAKTQGHTATQQR
jgi:hypothetical protein